MLRNMVFLVQSSPQAYPRDGVCVCVCVCVCKNHIIYNIIFTESLAATNKR